MFASGIKILVTLAPASADPGDIKYFLVYSFLGQTHLSFTSAFFKRYEVALQSRFHVCMLYVGLILHKAHNMEEV